MKKKIKNKVGSVFKKIFILLIVVFSILSFSITTSANTSNGNLNPSDTSIYNDATWHKGNIEVFSHKYRDMDFGIGSWKWWHGVDYTKNYLRITDDDDNLVKINRLECSYVIDGVIYNISSELIDDGNEFWTVATSIGSKYGYFMNMTEDGNKNGLEIFGSEYKECNYFWSWSWNVEEIRYLYCWYDDSNGNLHANSFYENGEHPYYNEDGSVSILDSENKILDGYELNEYGVICNTSGDELIEVDNQIIKEVVENNNSTSLTDYLKTLGNKAIFGLTILFSIFVFLALVWLLKVFSQIYRNIKG